MPLLFALPRCRCLCGDATELNIDIAIPPPEYHHFRSQPRQILTGRKQGGSQLGVRREAVRRETYDLDTEVGQEHQQLRC